MDAARSLNLADGRGESIGWDKLHVNLPTPVAEALAVSRMPGTR